MQKLLIVKFLRQHFLFCCRTVYNTLIRKNEFSLTEHFSAPFQDSRFLHFLEIKKQNTRIYIIRLYKIFSVMIPRARIFNIADIRRIKKIYIPIEQNVNIKIKKWRSPRISWKRYDLLQQKSSLRLTGYTVAHQVMPLPIRNVCLVAMWPSI